MSICELSDYVNIIKICKVSIMVNLKKNELNDKCISNDI